jgi:hypothetical protein
MKRHARRLIAAAMAPAIVAGMVRAADLYSSGTVLLVR